MEVHQLIRECLQTHIDSLPPGSPAQQEAAARAEAITLEWLLSVLSRMHVNAFRWLLQWPSVGIVCTAG